MVIDLVQITGDRHEGVVSYIVLDQWYFERYCKPSDLQAILRRFDSVWGSISEIRRLNIVGSALPLFRRFAKRQNMNLTIGDMYVLGKAINA